MPEEKKAKKPRGVVTIDKELCKGCGFCIEFCPTEVLKFSEEFNSKGYHPPLVARPEACTGCDLCGIYCPDFAIFGILIKKVA
jgi:2-oxoglutarate ferredoxin oxidoreductase subunit delta